MTQVSAPGSPRAQVTHTLHSTSGPLRWHADNVKYNQLPLVTLGLLRLPSAQTPPMPATRECHFSQHGGLPCVPPNWPFNKLLCLLCFCFCPPQPLHKQKKKKSIRKVLCLFFESLGIHGAVSNSSSASKVLAFHPGHCRCFQTQEMDWLRHKQLPSHHLHRG